MTPLRILPALVLVATTLSVAATRTFAQGAGQSSAALPTMKAIRFGKLVDGTGAIRMEAVVVVEGDRIKSVSTSGSSIPAGVEVIDLSGYTAIPA